jgi:hypothetical protein
LRAITLVLIFSRTGAFGIPTSSFVHELIFVAFFPISPPLHRRCRISEHRSVRRRRFARKIAALDDILSSALGVARPMPAHKFQVGEIVHLSPAIARNLPGGSYAIVKQLPQSAGEFGYRVKNTNEPHERVVRESELRKP